MMKLRFAFLAALLAAPAAAQQTPEQKLADWSRPVDAARLKATVEKLVSFGTRHTLSSQTDPKRGIGASVRWFEGELKKLGLQTLQTCDTVTKPPRVPTPTKVCNAVGIQRGTERPNDVVIITGHIDSRVSDVMNATADSPGANDDGSGTATVLEAARVLHKRKFPGTIVYAALSGEEQGLLGGKILADYARAQGWNVIANLNNDIIGNSCGSDRVCNDKQVRVFSEGPRWQGREELAPQIRSLGGENDSPSRNISRFLDRLAERVPEIGIDVLQIWRNDRFGRGGDHTEFLNAGYPAVRLSVAVEDYNAQHQDLRTERKPGPSTDCSDEENIAYCHAQIRYGDTVDKMDFPYLAKVARLNVAALAAIASAPPPPEPTVEGAVSTDTRVKWSNVGKTDTYRVYQRRTDASNWIANDDDVIQMCMHLPVAECARRPADLVLKGIRVDDWVFGVASVSADGFESPVASAVPGGAFKPYVAPPPKP
jgi:hypothetical protein